MRHDDAVAVFRALRRPISVTAAVGEVWGTGRPRYLAVRGRIADVRIRWWRFGIGRTIFVNLSRPYGKAPRAVVIVHGSVLHTFRKALGLDDGDLVENSDLLGLRVVISGWWAPYLNEDGVITLIWDPGKAKARRVGKRSGTNRGENSLNEH